MPPKKSEMDGVICVPLIPHERRMLRSELQVQQDAPHGVSGPTKCEQGIIGLDGMLQEEVIKLRIRSQIGT